MEMKLYAYLSVVSS